MRLKIGRWLGVAAVLAGAGAALALLVACSGIFNIAASAGHPVWVERFLELGMTRSIQHNSRNIVPPADLHSMDRIRVGAAHFAGACADCHGAPATPGNPVYAYMLPTPPDLALHAPQWAPREQYFIVRHGLQFTGMPEWSGGARADEVWSMVAFLQELPELGSDDYRALASGNNSTASAPSASAAVRDAGVKTLARTACDRCHDTPQAAPPSSLVPRLAGQPVDYLARSLHEYRRGERRSGFMQPVAAMLSAREIEELAMHYSRMPAAAPADVTAPASAPLAEAALIASGAHAELRLPACLSCHGAQARSDYPVLTGQHAAYLAQQLRLFQSGGRQGTAFGEVMTVIARRLDTTQIDALAQWFAQQAAPGTEE